MFLHSLNTALTAHTALKWSNLVILHGYNVILDNTEMNEYLAKLIEAQANLSAAALASADKKLANKMYTLLAYEWSAIKVFQVIYVENTYEWSAIKDIEVIYVENLTKLELGNGVIILASLLTKYLVATKRNDLVEQLKVNIILRIHM